MEYCIELSTDYFIEYNIASIRYISVYIIIIVKHTVQGIVMGIVQNTVQSIVYGQLQITI